MLKNSTLAPVPFGKTRVASKTRKCTAGHKTIAKLRGGSIASGEKISDRAVLTMFFASCVLQHPFHIEYFPKRKTLRRRQCKVAGELESV